MTAYHPFPSYLPVSSPRRNARRPGRHCRCKAKLARTQRVQTATRQQSGTSSDVLFHAKITSVGLSNMAKVERCRKPRPPGYNTSGRFLTCDALRCTVFVIVILSGRLSVCPSVTLVDCVHMVRPTIMISSPYGSPIILVSGDIKFIPKFEGGHTERGR